MAKRNSRPPGQEMAKVRLKIQFNGASLGPGKIALLEQIHRRGSISAAARSSGMAYRRAWHLINTLQEALDEKVLDTQTGGKEQGGDVLTPFGQALVTLYRTAEADAAGASEELMALLRRHGL